jgi:hypothetical protein
MLYGSAAQIGRPAGFDADRSIIGHQNSKSCIKLAHLSNFKPFTTRLKTRNTRRSRVLQTSATLQFASIPLEVLVAGGAGETTISLLNTYI